MRKLNFWLIFIISVTILACGKSRYRTVCKTGILKLQGITTYQYGSHILEDNAGKTLYALTIDSNNNIATFINKNVEISGTFTEGYPVEGGPELIAVTRIATK
jgi:hypothetical protein